MLKIAAGNFILAMLPGNVFAPLNILAGFICVIAAGVDAIIEYK